MIGNVKIESSRFLHLFREEDEDGLGAVHKARILYLVTSFWRHSPALGMVSIPECNTQKADTRKHKTRVGMHEVKAQRIFLL